MAWQSTILHPCPLPHWVLMMNNHHRRGIKSICVLLESLWLTQNYWFLYWVLLGVLCGQIRTCWSCLYRLLVMWEDSFNQKMLKNRHIVIKEVFSNRKSIFPIITFLFFFHTVCAPSSLIAALEIHYLGYKLCWVGKFSIVVFLSPVYAI